MLTQLCLVAVALASLIAVPAFAEGERDLNPQPLPPIAEEG